MTTRLVKIQLRMQNITTRTAIYSTRLVKIQLRMHNITTRPTIYSTRLVKIQLRMHNMTTRMPKIQMRMQNLKSVLTIYLLIDYIFTKTGDKQKIPCPETKPGQRI